DFFLDGKESLVFKHFGRYMEETRLKPTGTFQSCYFSIYLFYTKIFVGHFPAIYSLCNITQYDKK
ncbi:MAG TPA: hypothetical protein QGI40_04235, partial [Nitrospinaceae bacterium]|nr:hypothetical protein [Nitrospinaceae bacterium]